METLRLLNDTEKALLLKVQEREKIRQLRLKIEELKRELAIAIANSKRV